MLDALVWTVLFPLVFVPLFWAVRIWQPGGGCLCVTYCPGVLLQRSLQWPQMLRCLPLTLGCLRGCVLHWFPSKSLSATKPVWVVLVPRVHSTSSLPCMHPTLQAAHMAGHHAGHCSGWSTEARTHVLFPEYLLLPAGPLDWQKLFLPSLQERWFPAVHPNHNKTLNIYCEKCYAYLSKIVACNSEP